MNAISWILSSLINSYKKHKIESDKILNIKQRNLNFPTCQLSDNCSLIDSNLGNNVVVHPNTTLLKSNIGNHTYISSYSTICYSVIGSYCSIGENVRVGLWRHPARKSISTYPAFFSNNNLGCNESFVTESSFDENPQQTYIGHDVWIGQNVLIPGGISIGSGAIIAAGSVVVKNVSPYSIVGGNPATIIRYRFNEKDISFLLQTKWWNWHESQLIEIAESFQDISTFRNAVNKINNLSL